MGNPYRIDNVVFDLDVEGDLEARNILNNWLENSKDKLLILVNENPFAERINYLMSNPHLAKKESKDSAGRMKPSNCAGTALWVAKLTERESPANADTSDVEKHLTNNYKKIPGSFNITWDKEGDVNHMGIYLGHINYFRVMFAQCGPGGDFVYEAYLQRGDWKKAGLTSPRYYVPRTLKL